MESSIIAPTPSKESAMGTQVVFEDQTVQSVELNSIKFNLRTRIERALKGSGILVCASLLSILVPVFHIVLFPGLLVSAVVIGYRRFSENSCIDLTDFKCPKCHESLNEKKVFQTKLYPFSKVYCFYCRTSMKVFLKS
jgi:hypothetical protein